MPVQSVGGEGGSGRLQGAGGVGASHVGQEVGVGTQLMDVEAVLLTVRQAPADKGLRSRAQSVCQCEAVCQCHTKHGGLNLILRDAADAKKVGEKRERTF